MNRSSVLFALLAALIQSAASDMAAQDAAPASAAVIKPVAAVDRAIIISADGMRPDVMLRARTPNIRRLMETGTFTMWARTVPQSITLPSHTSMLTGVTPERHRVLWNSDLPEPIYPQVPTIFEVAKHAGLTTAMVTGKSKFSMLSRPRSVDWERVDSATDKEVGTRAAAVLRLHKPNVLVIHFPGADGAGHGKGWGSPEQIEAIEIIDQEIGLLLESLASQGLAESTVVILSSDHGGAGKSHGPNDPRSRHIPWILRGPGVRKGYDLTRDANLTVNTEDTFATACWFLGLRPPGKIDGKRIEQVLEDRELLRDMKR